MDKEKQVPEAETAAVNPDSAAETEETAAEPAVTPDEETAEAATEETPEESEDDLDTFAEEPDIASIDEVMEGGDLQPLDEETDPDSIPGDQRCERCETRRRDTERGLDYPYCAACREEMLHTKVGWEAAILTLVVLLMAAAAALLFILQVPTLQKSLEAGALMRERRYVDAYQSYDDVYAAAEESNASLGGTALFTGGTKTGLRQMEAIARGYSAIDAGSYASENFTEEQLASRRYKRAAEYRKVYEDFNAVYQAVGEIWMPYNETSPEEIPYEEIIAEIDALKDSGESYAEYIWVFYKYRIALLARQSDETQLAFLKELETLQPEALWLYSINMIQYYLHVEEDEEVLRYCDKLIDANKNETYSYSTKAKILMNQKEYAKAAAVAEEAGRYNPDSTLPDEILVEVARRQNKLDAARRLCESAINEKGNSVELSRQLAIIQLLKKDYDTAFQTLYEIYSYLGMSGQNPSQAFLDTLILASYFAEDDSVGRPDGLGFFEWAKSLYEDNDAEFSPLLKDCVDGTITVEDIFLRGKGDIS